MRRRTLINNKERPKARLIQHVDTILGDFVFYDSSSDSMLYYRFDDGGEDIIPDTCIPIGAVAIPYELSGYFDKACGVVALENLGYTVWGNTNSFITENITQQNAGKEKTQAIIEHRGTKPEGWTPDIDNPDDFPAASLCNLYSTIGTNQGDWYLPSSDELMACNVIYNIFFDYKSDEFIKYYGDYEISSIPWSCDEENSSDAISLGMTQYGYTWGMFQTPKTSYRDVNPFIQIGGMKVNYGDIVISGGTVNDIPASGGESQVSGYTYSQTYGYGDSYTDGGTITSGAEVSVTSVSGGDLVDNETERVKKGDSVLTVTMNGKTVTKSYPVYQEANVATYGDIVVKNSGTASVIPASGGSSTASGVVCEQTVSYTSNYSKKANILYGNYTTVSVGSLGATEKAQSVVGNSVVVVTGGGGKQIEVKVPVYQQENKANATSAITAYGTPTVSIDSGITCKGGSATVTHNVTNTRTYYYTSNTPGKTENIAGTTTIKITSNGNSRFSLSGNTLSHSNMTTNAVTDSCTITATNSGDTSKTKTATVSVTNNADATSAITEYGTPTVSIDSGITCSGGSATITSNVSNTKTYYYCSGSAGRTESVAGTVNLTISHQSFSTSTSKGTNGNISRFSLSGTKLSHSSMTTNVGYDHVTITATNASSTSKSASASTYVRNYETSSKITAYGTPSVSIGSGITCSGGSATVSHSVTNTRTYYYCTGSVSRSVSEAGTTTIKITSNGNSRFSLSGNTLSHSTMGKNEVTDSCTITATNSGDTSKTKTATVSVTNTSTTTYSNITIGTISNKTIAASGGSATATAGNGSQTWTKTYCSGQKDTGTISVPPNVTSISGSASSKGETSSGQTTVKSQSVTWSANGKSASGTMYVYQAANSFSGCSVACSISSSSVSRLGGSITVSGNATVTWSSGSYAKTPSRQISDQNAGASISGSTITFGKNTSTSARYAYARNYISYNGSTYYSDAKKINQNGKVANLEITATHGSQVTYKANYAPDVDISCNGSFGMKDWDGTTYYWTSYATITAGTTQDKVQASSGNGGTNASNGTYTGWTVLNCSPKETEKYDITIYGV